MAINEIHTFADTSRTYEPLVAHTTFCGTHNNTLNVSCPDCPFGIIRSGVLYKNTPVNPTRFDSMAKNGYDVDAPPLLSMLLLLLSLRFTVRWYTIVRLSATIPSYVKCFYATVYGTYTVLLYKVC